MSLVDGKLHHALMLLETRVDQLERKLERLQSCEGCAPVTRCLRCERDLCPECLQKETCAHSRDGRHV